MLRDCLHASSAHLEPKLSLTGIIGAWLSLSEGSRERYGHAKQGQEAGSVRGLGFNATKQECDSKQHAG
jgi:hypothetical protein